MPREAKIKLSADIGGLRREVKQAEALLTSFVTSTGKKLDRLSIRQVALKGIRQRQDQGMNEATRAVREMGEWKGKGGGGGAGGGGQQGGGGRGVLSMLGSTISSIIGIGIGVATIGALYRRRLSEAESNLRTRALTGGAAIPTGRVSRFGFSAEDQRERSIGIGKAVGQNLNQTQLIGAIDQSEQLERDFGITGEQSSGLMGAARKAGAGGIAEQSKILAQTVGGARTAGLTGSRVEEYLGSMTNFLSQISEGVNIDQSSLQGFASSIAGMPFFKDDPSRTFRAAQTMDQAFKGGDRFGQALTANAMRSMSGGASPYAMEMKRGAGLFGGIDKEELKQMGFTGADLDFMALKGVDIQQKRAEILKGQLAGRGFSEQMFGMATGLGFSPGDRGGMQIASKMLKGGRLNEKEIKQLEKAGMTPEARLEDALDRNALSFSSKVEALVNSLSLYVEKPVTALGQIISSAFNVKEGEQASAGGVASKVGDAVINQITTGGAGGGGIQEPVFKSIIDMAHTGRDPNAPKKKGRLTQIREEMAAGKEPQMNWFERYFLQMDKLAKSLDANTAATKGNTNGGGTKRPSNSTVVGKD